jgi:hypothetical protein
MIVDKEYSSIKFEASKMLFVDVNVKTTINIKGIEKELNFKISDLSISKKM